MIVKTNFPDYLMHYGVSINDGAPGVGTGNWRRGNVTSKVVEYPDGGYGYKTEAGKKRYSIRTTKTGEKDGFSQFKRTTTKGYHNETEYVISKSSNYKTASNKNIRRSVQARGDKEKIFDGCEKTLKTLDKRTDSIQNRFLNMAKETDFDLQPESAFFVIAKDKNSARLQITDENANWPYIEADYDIANDKIFNFVYIDDL